MRFTPWSEIKHKFSPEEHEAIKREVAADAAHVVEQNKLGSQESQPSPQEHPEHEAA